MTEIFLSVFIVWVALSIAAAFFRRSKCPKCGIFTTCAECSAKMNQD